eukprot:21058-Heterococcus_DN1.PRE.1
MLRSCRDTICAADSLRAIAALVARHNRCTDAAHCMLLALTSNKLFPYPRSNPLVLVQEVDCCRIISQQRMELLQRVPPTTEAINRIGSTDPAAMLFDATEAFEDGDAKADENIRAMARAEAPPTDHTSTSANATDDSTSSSSGEGVLQEAVRSCTAAAAVEFDTLRQKALLRAAAYGKGFLPDYDSDDFVACCRKLRVLNAIRSAEVGVPLTAQQYDTIGAEAVIDMLIRRRLHLLALKACQHLRLPAEGVAIRCITRLWHANTATVDAMRVWLIVDLYCKLLLCLIALMTVHLLLYIYKICVIAFSAVVHAVTRCSCQQTVYYYRLVKRPTSN